MTSKISIADSFAKIHDFEHPRVAAMVNECAVKFVKLKGDFVWHHHDEEDELFMVVQGTLLMKLRDGDVEVHAGEMILIPHGVEHCPVAEEEVHLILFERASTLNTGNVVNEKTRATVENL
ncbi:MAG: cupin domain-containing protein [Calditrichaeota bacterium]|nr:cupin domain-containing protein [Calditrichota bacterium]